MSSQIRQRVPPNPANSGITKAKAIPGPRDNPPQQPLLVQETTSTTTTSTQQPDTSNPTIPSQKEMENLSKKSQWIVLALASGACASFNGVFAKLTTTELTTSFATWVATTIGLSNIEGGVEVVVRAIFFLLNLLFNAIMWTLFTKALARGTSTTQVSILNTSSNFLLTAFLGALIFSESLPPLWFVGAALLVAGNVIIGRRDEGEGKDGEDGRGNYDQVGREREGAGVEGESLLVGGRGESVDLEDLERRRREREEGDILQLASEDSQEARDDLQLL